MGQSLSRLLLSSYRRSQFCIFFLPLPSPFRHNVFNLNDVHYFLYSSSLSPRFTSRPSFRCRRRPLRGTSSRRYREDLFRYRSRSTAPQKCAPVVYDRTSRAIGISYVFTPPIRSRAGFQSTPALSPPRWLPPYIGRRPSTRLSNPAHPRTVTSLTICPRLLRVNRLVDPFPSPQPCLISRA